MDGFQPFFGWVTGNEPLLSGLAAIVVIAGVAVSPLGHGVRMLLDKKKQKSEPHSHHPVAGLPSAAEDRPSIAVLPFKNLSHDQEQEFLADGMTEDIITGLALSRSLFVIDRNSCFTYKGRSIGVRDVSHELGVHNILEGSVRRVGDSLRVNAQLIDGRTGAHLWAQMFDRPVAEIFKVQDEITASIVAALTSQLRSAVASDIARARPDSLDSWQLCQRARAEFDNSAEPGGRRNAEALYREAVKKDPDYAVGWISLGVAIAFQRYVEPAAYSAAQHDEAEACVQRAMKLACGDPDVLAGYGRYLMVNGHPERAVGYLEQARQLNPYEVAYRAQLARALVNCGRAEEALVETQAVLRLSPRDPFKSNHDYQLAEIYLALGRPADSEAAARRAIAGGVGGVFATLVLANAIGAQGRIEEARETIRQGIPASRGLTLKSVATMYRDLGIEENRLATLLQHLKAAWPVERT